MRINRLHAVLSPFQGLAEGAWVPPRPPRQPVWRVPFFSSTSRCLRVEVAEWSSRVAFAAMVTLGVVLL